MKSRKNTKKANEIRKEIVEMLLKARVTEEPVNNDVLTAKYNELEKLDHAGGFAFNCKSLNVSV